MSYFASLPVVLLFAGLFAGAFAVRERDGSRARAQVKTRSSPAVLRMRDIALYERRVAEDPISAADLTRLAGLYLQRGRETADAEDFRRAAKIATRSLALREGRNAQALLVRASALLALHRFGEARALAERLCRLEPQLPSYCALLGEIQLELGDYDAARATFAVLRYARGNLAVAPRLARWAELEGRPDEAARLLRTALAEARRRPDLPREQLAWFYLRLGDLELRHGRLRAAHKTLRAGLDTEPSDFRLLGALARVEALRGHWRQAIRYGVAAGDAADIATLALIGDAHRALGHEPAAQRYFARAERAGLERPEPYNRQWTLFRLEHDVRMPATLEILQREIEGRTDVYGYDQLAWALYQTGDFAAARVAADAALRMATRDAMLYFHAAMIDLGLGERGRARQQLETALEMNPYFHHRYAAEARRALESLD